MIRSYAGELPSFRAFSRILTKSSKTLFWQLKTVSIFKINSIGSPVNLT